MRLFCDEAIGIGVFSGKVESKQTVATIVVKVQGRIQPGQPASLVPDAPSIVGDVNDDTGEFRYPSDFAPFKRRGDVIVVGTAYSPGGVPTTTATVAYRVGQSAKSLQVVGDRVWTSGYRGEMTASEPSLFASMPLSYRRAYGGPSYRANPIGRGHGTADAPNVEYARRPSRGPTDRAPVAGFGPVPMAWEPRNTMVGTYDDAWLKEHWPWFPKDFDWLYFNAAPEDQQIEGYLQGDEPLECHNLHAEHPVYRSALPGLRARCFVEIDTPEGKRLFREVALNLDTLWIDMAEEKIVLVWRGLTRVRTLKLKELAQVFAFMEPVSEPARSVEENRQRVYERFLKPEVDAPEPPPETDADPTGEKQVERELANMDKEFETAEKETAAAESAAEAALSAHTAQLIAQGVNAEQLAAAVKPQTFAEMRGELARTMSLVKESDPGRASQLQAELVELEATEREIEAAEKEIDAAEAELTSAPEHIWTAEDVRHALTTGGTLSGQDLSGLDLSGLDFSRADLSGSTLKGATLKQSTFVQATLHGVDFSGANLSGVDLSGAVLDDADFTRATLANATCAEASVNGTVFTKLDLRQVDFAGCVGKGPDFSGADLAGASFTGARLPQSDFSGCSLRRASFVGAELQAAQFDGAQGEQIEMAGADLTGLHGGDQSNFSRGNFRGVKGPGSIWEAATLDGADFSRAQLTRAQFSEASLRETNFDRAQLEHAVFDDGMLEGTLLTNTNLLRASFDRANLSGADVRGSNAFEAGFWDAVIQRTDFRGSNLKSTLLLQGHGYRTSLEE